MAVITDRGHPERRRPQEQMGLKRRLIESVQEDDVLGLSAEIAFRFLFAVFPFGLFVAALGAVIAGYLQIDNPAEQIVDGLGDNPRRRSPRPFARSSSDCSTRPVRICCQSAPSPRYGRPPAGRMRS
jgi:hypothetical protein